ncbi:MAG: GNAT family N-acetyltransferase [Flavobacteriales bacterium]|nr:GNAT family N-acetyltransferase [Flavobacteriales bacterium]MBK9060263.1 GNAT family N-acetyltransferase [Flavobacteriales bacterium]QQS71682.1 MAG: GNAT family N-acetyltransferase [Flavobacteriales bacterium]HQV40303.1 GNAT family N-acyltransferase [Flavobacteriales bacterium]HQW33311.1 GNAT family N-acyltransferase [Flavobacteriales bacterium]
MPTLRPITTKAELEAYHQFRYRIYANSEQSGYLSGKPGFDIDAYDAHAIHLGWYEREELVGCVRLLDPIEGADPLHFLKDLDLGQRQLADELLQQERANGIPFCEVSRLCIDPAYRSLAHARHFVLAIIQAAVQHGRDISYFTCDHAHAAFWQRMGFAVVPGFESYVRARSPHKGALLRGSSVELLQKHRKEIMELGLLLAVPYMIAA